VSTDRGLTANLPLVVYAIITQSSCVHHITQSMHLDILSRPSEQRQPGARRSIGHVTSLLLLNAAPEASEVTLAASLARSWVSSRGPHMVRFGLGLHLQWRFRASSLALNNGCPGSRTPCRASPLPPERRATAPWPSRRISNSLPATTNRLADTAQALPATEPPSRLA